MGNKLITFSTIFCSKYLYHNQALCWFRILLLSAVVTDLQYSEAPVLRIHDCGFSSRPRAIIEAILSTVISPPAPVLASDSNASLSPASATKVISFLLAIPARWSRDLRLTGVTWHTGSWPRLGPGTASGEGRWSANLMPLTATLTQVDVKGFPSFFFFKVAHLSELVSGYCSVMVFERINIYTITQGSPAVYSLYELAQKGCIYKIIRGMFSSCQRWSTY